MSLSHWPSHLQILWRCLLGSAIGAQPKNCTARKAIPTERLTSPAVEKQTDQARATVLKTMQHWQQDSDFAGIRGDALAKLPEAERKAWMKLWKEVQLLHGRAAAD